MTLIKDYHKTAIIAGERRVSYAELLRRITLFAKQVPQDAGSRTVIFSKNREGWAYAFFSVWLNRGIAVPVDASSTVDEVAYVLRDCRPDYVWTTRKRLDTLKPAVEKAGIIKPGVPVVLGRNEPSVRAVVEARAKEVDAPFYYAPDLASESEIPADFSLVGSFNRENAVTALAALKVLEQSNSRTIEPFSRVIWPGRFQRIGNFIVDGAHNPPAAKALVRALESEDVRRKTIDLVCGFCGDKDIGEVLSILAPFVKKGYAVKTNNPRSLSAEETAAKMRAAGIDASPCGSLREAIEHSNNPNTRTVVCGSLFLVGEALVELGAYPWGASRFDPAELLKV